MIQKVGDWRKLEKLLTVPELNRRITIAGTIATKRAGLLVVRNIRNKIRQTTSPPNAPWTIQRKGSSKPLQDRGDLWQSVTFIPLAPLMGWVGVPAGKSNRDSGASLALIAKVLEGGEIGAIPKDTIIVPRTARSLFIPLRRGVKPGDPDLQYNVDFALAKVVRIRPRPFIGPAVEESKEAVYVIYQQAVDAALRSFLR